MNLYIFNETRLGAVFGVGTYIRELTTSLKNSNINICVINLFSDRKNIYIEEIDSIKYWFFPAPILEQQKMQRQEQWNLYHRNIIYLLQLHINDKKNLIFHLNYNQKGQLAKELKKAFNCSIVVTIHFFDWCFKLSGNLSQFRKILSYEADCQFDDIIETVQTEKSLFETSDHTLCLSKNTLQILQNEYKISPNKITVIYNGLADSNITLDKQVLRKKYHIPDIPIFLFAGRLDDIKGLTYALKAFKILLSKQSECHFIIAGDGNFSAYLKECEDIWMHITWTGLISKEKLYDLYQIADIGIMPSFHEQCSYVAIEMMMHGLPIIGNTSTGLKEMILDGKTGLHIPVIEYEDRVDIDTSLLAEKMLYLLQNPKERKLLGANARKRYEDVYSSEVFRKKMIAFYSSLFTVDKNSILSNSSQTNI